MKSIQESFGFLKNYEYSTKPVLNEDTVKEFEEKNQFTFPEQYRYFLLNIGAEISIEGQYGPLYIGGKIINSRKKVATNSNLHKEFLFDKPYEVRYDEGRPDNIFYNTYSDCAADENSDEDVCIACPHSGNCIDEFYDDDVDLDYCAFWHGSYTIAYAGCTYTYQLVLNGPHRGEVWIFDELVQAVPVASDFASFVEHVFQKRVY